MNADFGRLPGIVELDVTGRDLARGKRCSSADCPLALAATRTFSELLGRRVKASAGYSVTIRDPALDLRIGRYWIGADGLRLEERFDRGQIVKPCTVRIYKPGTGMTGGGGIR